MTDSSAAPTTSTQGRETFGICLSVNWVSSRAVTEAKTTRKPAILLSGGLTWIRKLSVTSYEQIYVLIQNTDRRLQERKFLAETGLHLRVRIILKHIGKSWVWRRVLDSACSKTCVHGRWNSVSVTGEDSALNYRSSWILNPHTNFSTSRVSYFKKCNIYIYIYIYIYKTNNVYLTAASYQI